MFSSRLKSEQADNLDRAILALNSEEDCYRLFEDLFTIREIQDLGQRLEVARLLQNQSTYTEIVERTGVSTATIGRVMPSPSRTVWQTVQYLASSPSVVQVAGVTVL